MKHRFDQDVAKPFRRHSFVEAGQEGKTLTTLEIANELFVRPGKKRSNSLQQQSSGEIEQVYFNRNEIR